MIDFSHGTSAHAQKGRGLREEVLKMLNCETVNFGQISIQNPTQFSRTFGAKTNLTVVYTDCFFFHCAPHALFCNDIWLYKKRIAP